VKESGEFGDLIDLLPDGTLIQFGNGPSSAGALPY